MQSPTTPESLHAFLTSSLHLTLPREALLPGHSAPFDYLLHSFTQGAATGAPADCVLWANRGGGKTFLGAVATLLDLVFLPGIEVRILAGSLDQSKRMHAHLRRFFDPERYPALRFASDNAKLTDRRITLANGSSVELLAASQTSVRGTRVQKLRCDEVDLFDPELWDAAQLVTRSARCGETDVVGCVECLSTMHIPHGVMHRLVAEARAGRRALFRWGVVDVLEHCPPARDCAACSLHPECRGLAKARPPQAAGHITIDDALTMKSRVPAAVWESEMLCLRPRRSDCVIPEFDPARHIIKDDLSLQALARDPGSTIYAGMDFGIRGLTVVLFACVAADGRAYIVDEHAQADATLDTHIEAIRRMENRWGRPSAIAIDPAGLSRNDQTGISNAEVLARAGYKVLHTRTSLLGGIRAIQTRLAPADRSPARLFIHQRCAKLIESLERYHYPRDNPDSLEPVKGEGHDHAVDALRYLITNLDSPETAVMRKWAQ